MKIEVKTVEPVPPPSEIVLTLTEEEAYLVKCFAEYYATAPLAPPLLGLRAAAAKRLVEKLKPLVSSSKAVYPYEKAFK